MKVGSCGASDRPGPSWSRGSCSSQRARSATTPNGSPAFRPSRLAQNCADPVTSGGGFEPPGGASTPSDHLGRFLTETALGRRGSDSEPHQPERFRNRRGRSSRFRSVAVGQRKISIHIPSGSRTQACQPSELRGVTRVGRAPADNSRRYSDSRRERGTRPRKNPI